MASASWSPAVGTRVVVSGLTGGTELNSSRGTIIEERENNRWAVQLDGVQRPVSIAASNLGPTTQGAGANAGGAQCLIVDAMPLDASVEQIRAGIRPFLRGGLPLPVNASRSTEAEEKQILRRELGWRDVQGLFGYSETCLYKDLYIYFDHADTTSVPNELATKAFKMYGLGGAQHVIDWTQIRGAAIIVRGDPPTIGGVATSYEFKPVIPIDEMVRTLCFFRDHKRSAQHVANTRDAQRMHTGMQGFGASPDMYVGPAGRRDYTKIFGRDRDMCSHCGVTAATLGRKLFECARCRVAKYCSKGCQKAAWKSGHREQCKSCGSSSSSTKSKKAGKK